MSAKQTYFYAPTIKFQPLFLKPKYWGTWLMLSFLWLVIWLPRKWTMKIGAFVGDQMRRRNSKRRHIVEVNIRLCFPNLSEIQRQQMVKDHFRCYGRGLVDMGLAMMGSVRRVEKYSDVVGFENLKALPKTQKIVLITYHTTTLDMGWRLVLADIDLVSMMKRDKNPVLNWFLYRSRTRYKKVLVLMRDQGLRGIIKGMNNGKLCYFIPDEDFGDGKHAVFAPFFGQQRSTLNIISRLAKITDAVVIPSICRLMPETGRYRTTIGPPLENFPAGNYVADATNMHQAMEKLILDAPEQYMWTFRWFRTQPDEKPDFYK